MKNLSKVLAVVLAFAMALSMVSFAYTDVAEDANYAEAVAVLSALDILEGYEDGSFRPENTITRAEFATVVIRMLGLADSASTSEVFSDVPADHWANGYIALAAQQGIVNGYGDGRFGPEDPVKYEEAIKMVVNALGYEPMANAYGGYPGGHKVVAGQKGILAGITGAKDAEPANRAVVAKLAYNSLTAPLMERTSFGDEEKYETVNMLLINKLGVTKFEGSVVGTSASGDTKVGKVKIKANYQITGVKGEALAKKYVPGSVNTNPTVGAEYNTGVTIAANGEVEEAAKALLDTASIIYVKDAGTEAAELVCILKDGNRNATVEFMAEDLKVNASLTSAGVDTLEVYTDEATGEYEEYDVDIDTVYVNGQKKSVEALVGTAIDTDGDTVPDYTPAPLSGGVAAGVAITTDVQKADVVNHYLRKTQPVDVKLLSNGADEDVFNVAYITVWTDVVVDRVSERNSTVYYAGGSLKLDETSKTQNFVIYKDGDVAEFADIAENDVLSIAGYVADKELKYGDVYITSEKVEGVVTGKATSGNDIKVDGTNYKTNGLSVNLGDKAVFYVNARGVLVGLDKTATGTNLKYGYVSYIYVDPNFGDAQVRMLTADGKWVTADVADKFTAVKADGTDVEKLTETNTTWTSVGGVVGAIPATNMFAVNNVVAYELNDEGEIDVLFMKNNTNSESTFSNTGIATSAGTTKDKAYVADTGRLGSSDIDDSTIIFTMDPAWTLGNGNKLTDEDKISVVSVSTLLDRELYNIAVGYNMDEDTYIVPVLAGYDIVSGIDWTTDFFTVSEEPYQTTNADGDEGIMLKGIVANEVVEIFLNSEDLESGDVQKVVYGGGTTDLKAATHTTIAENTIAKGDVLLYNVNAKGEAAKVLVLVDATDVTAGSNSYSALSYINATTDAQARLGEVTVSSTTYTFIMGYAKKMDNGKVTLVANDGTFNANGAGTEDDTVTGYTENIYRFGAEATGSMYDKFTGVGKVTEAMYGDVTSDLTFGTAGNANDGDMVFARVANGVVIEDFVIIANDR